MAVYLNGTGGVEKVSIDGKKVKDKLDLETYEYTLTLPTKSDIGIYGEDFPNSSGASPSLLTDGKTVISYNLLGNGVVFLKQYDILKDNWLVNGVGNPAFEIPDTSIDTTINSVEDKRRRSIIIQGKNNEIYCITER